MNTNTQGNFRQSMKWLHTWAGIAVAIILYFMFVTGSAGYFNDEITYWMQPETPTVNNGIDQQSMMVLAEKRLAKVAPNATQWWVNFPIGREYALSIWWPEKTKIDADNDGKMDDEWHDEVLDLRTGEPIAVRKTGGGNTLYYMHYALHYIPSVLGYWLTSLCAMFMLIGLITGIVIHKQIFKDFFTFRAGKKQHSWRDMHNVLSVLPLPFHIMITYSGLLFLMFTTMPGVLTASYGPGEENRDRFYDAIYIQDAVHKDTVGIAANNISLSSVFPDVEQRWGKGQVSYIGIENRGDINAHIELGEVGYDGLESGRSLTYNAVNGDLQHASHGSKSSSAAMTFYNIMTMLHEGSFSGPLLRWLYFISGLMGAGMIATGMILWASKRRERADKKGFASNGLILIERLNVGTIVGLLIGIATYFWANRLLPVNFAERENWEIHSLFISWAATLAYPYMVAHKRSINKIWVDQLTIAAVLYGLLPVLNFLTTNVHLGNTLLSGNWVLAGFDLTMLVFSVCFAFSAYRMLAKEKKVMATLNTSNVKNSKMARNNTITTDKQVILPIEKVEL
ncbi:MAG: PepSY domain-containing protein [Colwellia sp.]|nr:PepSY domain-containing protein [Colwellia sp.]